MFPVSMFLATKLLLSIDNTKAIFSEILDEQFLVESYQASQIWATVFNRVAFEETLSVGAMSTIPDTDARAHLDN